MAFKDLTAVEFKRAIKKDSNAVILDVRTPGELQEGAIEGHIMINIMSPEFTEEIRKLDKSKNYYVYCRSGNRSVTACNFMASQGFDTLYNLLGGIGAWNQL